MSSPKNYRVWDPKLARFSYFDLFTAFGRIPEDTREFVQQSTGLQDMHGQEIYLGDYLGSEYTDDYEDTIYHHWEVVWFSGTRDVNGGEYADIYTGFAVKLIDSNDEYSKIGEIEGLAPKYTFTHYGGNGGAETNKCEIIGNIYES